MKSRKKHNYKKLMNDHHKTHAWRNDPTDPAKTKYYFGCMSLDSPSAPYYPEEKLYQAYLDRKNRGFDSSECWNLGDNICAFALPRLKYFRDHHVGVPGAFASNYSSLTEASKAYIEIIDQLIWAMDMILIEGQGDLEDMLAQESGYKNMTDWCNADHDGFSKSIQEHHEKLNNIIKQYSYMLFYLWD